jgi:hypothetical protein
MDLKKLNALIYYQIQIKPKINEEISLKDVFNPKPYWSKNGLSRSWTLVSQLQENYPKFEELEEPLMKIDWKYLSSLNNTFLRKEDPPLLELITKRCSIYKEELMQKALNPSRIQKYLDEGIAEELDNYI